MKIGVIWVGYQCADLLPLSLTPWVEAKRARLGGHDIKIAAVSIPFEGFPQDEKRDDTYALLDRRLHSGDIDAAFFGHIAVKETEARGRALKWLVEQGVDILVQWDSDEIATQQSIHSVLSFVESNPWIMSFRLSLKNAVFDKHTFLVEPFTPMRIHRVHCAGGYRAVWFWDDNNVLYRRPWEPQTGAAMRDVELSTMTIPASVTNPVHLSWLSNPRSKAKIAYQTLRWPECSFRWDEATDQLRFNEAYYAKRGLPLPEVIHD